VWGKGARGAFGPASPLLGLAACSGLLGRTCCARSKPLSTILPRSPFALPPTAVRSRDRE
jgi:hypothetical protein